jgi:hypothetical protein
MKPILKAQSNLSILGTNNKQDLSPKELWLKKEKQLKLKGSFILILSQLFWLFIFLGQDSSLPMATSPEISKEVGFELIKLPAVIYSQIPERGQKISVSLVREGSGQIIPAFLRGHEEDPLSMSGVKAILEIPQEVLPLIKNYKKEWKVYPPMKNQNQNIRSVHEINF